MGNHGILQIYPYFSAIYPYFLSKNPWCLPGVSVISSSGLYADGRLSRGDGRESLETTATWINMGIQPEKIVVEPVKERWWNMMEQKMWWYEWYVMLNKEQDTRSDGSASSLDFTNTSDFCRNTLDLINNRCKTQTYGSAHAKQWCCLLNFRLPQASDFGWAQNFWEIDPLASLLKKQMRLQADCSQDHYGVFKSCFWFIYRYRYIYIWLYIYDYIYIWLYIWLYIYMIIYIWLYIYMIIYIYMYMYTI